MAATYRVLSILALCAGASLLAGCVATDAVDAETPSPSSSPSASAPPLPTQAAPSSPAFVPSQEVEPDPPYAIPDVSPYEASRLVFESEGAEGVPETILDLSSSLSSEVEYELVFDCIPRSASITLTLRPAVGEEDPAVSLTGPVQVTQGCSAPGRETGVKVDRMVGVQISTIADGVDRAWAILRPVE